MDFNALQPILEIGETVTVEFKRCGNGIESDVYESVCSFLNRFGIEQDAACTQKEYATKLNVSLTTVKRLFAKLQKDKRLAREGTNRKGQWKVMKKGF